MKRMRVCVPLVLALVFVIGQGCAPTKKKKKPKTGEQEVIAGVDVGSVEISYGSQTQKRTLIRESVNHLSNKGPILIKGPVDPIVKVSLTTKGFQAGGSPLAKISFGNVERSVEARLLESAHEKLDIELDQPFFQDEFEKYQIGKLRIAFPASHSWIDLDVRIPPRGLQVLSQEVPWDSSRRLTFTHNDGAVQVRQFEIINHASFDYRLRIPQVALGRLERQFGGYKAIQEAECAGRYFHEYHRSELSNRLLVVPWAFTDEQVEQRASDFSRTFTEVVIPAKKNIFFTMYALIPAFKTVERLERCWTSSARIVTSCSTRCKRSNMGLCTEYERVHHDESFELMKSVVGHGVNYEKLWTDTEVHYADVPVAVSEPSVLEGPSSEVFRVNGTYVPSSRIDNPYVECLF